MSENLDLLAVIGRLLRAENVLILSHKNPDGDTTGSAAALMHALKNLGKEAAVLCSDAFPARYDYMQMELFTGQFEPGYVVSVDVASIQLFGDSIQEYTQQIDLCIDHHGSNAGYADAMFLDSAASSTCEIMYDLLCAMNVEITPVIADCLYTGLSTDTGCFLFSNTTAKAHYMAAKLMEAGARVQELNMILFESRSKGRMAIELTALQNLEYHFEDACALMYMTRQQIAASGVGPNELEDITSLPRKIEGVKVGVTMRQLPGASYKISIRTAEGVDACAIAKRLGGGGHARAAGCELEGNLENTKAAVLAEVERELRRFQQNQQEQK
ncbi:bifunctional oligoribonuclease/PAP phosphatase NrnA [uncultured Allofournierella sp.]|uniref:DHH family phosphoesterase n=1 Tax=uncultured Allofournierella sp. TaxID=1940258 RepID=UPI00375126C5